MLKTAQILRRFSFRQWGGAEHDLWNNVLGIRNHNMSAEVLSTKALSSQEYEECHGVPIRRFDCVYPYWPLTEEDRARLDHRGGNPLSLDLYRYLLQNEFHLLHVHSPGRIAGTVRAAARKKNIPYVVSFRCGYLQTPEEELRELERPLRYTVSYGFLLDLYHGLRRNFIADAAGIICVGEKEAALLKERWPEKRILRLPNGVDPNRFAKKTALDTRREFNIPSDRRILLCVSRINEQKNQKLLVRLTAALRERGENVHALLIGPPGAEYYLKELQMLADERGVTEFLTVIPGLRADDERLVAAYQAAEVFVMPSREESFGLVVLEAWSAGLPVIASAVAGLRQLVRDGENGLLFEPESLPDLIDSYYTLNRPGMRETLTANALREVKARYSYETVSARLAEFYHNTIEDHAMR